MPVYLEEAAQLDAVVTAAEAVGAEHGIPAGHEGPDLVGKRADVVGGGDERPATAGERALHPGRARLLGRVEAVPALRFEPLAAKLGEARHAPDVARDPEVGLEPVPARKHLAQARAG